MVSAKCNVTGELVAIKYVNDLGDCEYDWVKLIREIKIMHELTTMKQNYTVNLIDLIMT